MNPIKAKKANAVEKAPDSKPTTSSSSGRMKSMTLKPRMSEKTYALSQTQNTFVFDVPMTANKFEIASAVSAQFSVGVEDTRITIIKGKAMRTIRKGGRSAIGRRIDSKKAYVRLKAGDSIPVFAAIEKAEEDEKKAEEKAAKKVAKDKK